MRLNLYLLSCLSIALCSASCVYKQALHLDKRAFPPDADYQPLLIPKVEEHPSPEEIQSVHRRPRSFRYHGTPSSTQNRRQPSLRMSALVDWPTSVEAETGVEGEPYRVSEGPSLATRYAQQEEEDTAQSRLASVSMHSDHDDDEYNEHEGEDLGEDNDEEYVVNDEDEEETTVADDSHYVQDWSYYDDAEGTSTQDYAQPSQPPPSGVDSTTAILLRLAQRPKPRPRRKGAWHIDLPDCYKDILQAFCEKINMRKELIPNRQNVPRTFRKLSEDTIDSVIGAFTSQFGWDLDHALDEIIDDLLQPGRAGDGRGYDINWASMHTPKEVKRLRAIGRASGRKRVDNYLRSISYRRRMKALVAGTEEYNKLRTCRPWHRVSERTEAEGNETQDGNQRGE